MLEDVFLTANIESLNTNLKTVNALQVYFFVSYFCMRKIFLSWSILIVLDQYCKLTLS